MLYVLIALFLCFASPTLAQQNCPATPAPGTSNTTCANTAFVTQSLSLASCNVKAIGNKSAKGDGSTDDNAAFNACGSVLSAGGTLLIPAGIYCLKSGGFSVGNGIFIKGVGAAFGDNGPPTPSASSQISSCGVNNTVLNFNGNSVGMSGITVIGKSFGTVPAVIVSSQRVYLSDDSFYGGAPALLWNGSTQSIAVGIKVGQSYGTGNMVLQNSSVQVFGSVFNTPWGPSGGSPAVGSVNIGAIAARAPSTNYTALTSFVSATGPDGKTYFLRAQTTGTSSGGSQPTLLPYGTDIIDNTVTWRLVRPKGDASGNFYNVQCDTGADAYYDYGSDHSGAATGIGFTNTLSGAVPFIAQIFGGDFGSNLGNGILIHDGTHLSVNGAAINNCVATGCVGVNVAANITDVSITSNMIGDSNPNSAVLGAGTDYIVFSGNNCHGASIGLTNNGSGTHNYIPAGGNPGC